MVLQLSAGSLKMGIILLLFVSSVVCVTPIIEASESTISVNRQSLIVALILFVLSATLFTLYGIIKLCLKCCQSQTAQSIQSP